MPKCKFCQTDIKWKFKYKEVPTGEKNLPLNMDGSLHDCRPKPVEPEISPIAPESAMITPQEVAIPQTPRYIETAIQAMITESTKHTHLLQEILEAVKK